MWEMGGGKEGEMGAVGESGGGGENREGGARERERERDCMGFRSMICRVLGTYPLSARPYIDVAVLGEPGRHLRAGHTIGEEIVRVGTKE